MDRRRFVISTLARRCAALALAVGALSAADIVRAQDAWPARNITMIVPFPPGGQADFAARPVAEALKTVLGVSVTIDNRGGAGGAIGNAAAARAAPDGYTLLMTLSSLAVLVEAQRLFGRVPSYEVGQLVPIARVLADPAVFSVAKTLPYKTMQEFIADARTKPNTISFASSGYYGAAHVPMEMMAQAAGLKLVHVPYRGAGPAMNDVVAGQVDTLTSAPTTAKPQHEAGNIRTLAVFAAGRIGAFPTVPTTAELGYKDVEFYIWAGLFVQRGTPEPIVTRLRDAMRRIMQDPAVTKVFNDADSPPAYMDGPEFATFIDTDSERLIKAVRKIGMIEGKLE